MMSQLKSEFKKLFTVKSTYYIIAIVLLLVFFFAFYISGWRIEPKDMMNPLTLQSGITGAVSVVSIFSALVALLLVTHEYRYNTIMYTLTSSNSRSKVLFSKIIIMTGFALVFTLVFGALSPLFTALGIHAHHLHLVHQTIQYNNVIWRCLFYGWGYTMAGLLIASLVRNQVGAIITLFIVPGTVEGLLSLLLKKNTVYLPFSSLHQVIGQDVSTTSTLSATHAALVFIGYLLAALIVAWVLFLRRDAN